MADWIEELAAIVGRQNVLATADQILPYECDSFTLWKRTPRAVVLPGGADEVSRVVQTLARHKVPFVARGAGTGVSGGAIAEGGGVIIGLARMNRILSIDIENRLAVVEPGVVNVNLSRAVADAGYLYAPDPSSQTVCTIGGNVAENAGGPHCLKYGNTTNHILALEVVLPNGAIVNLGNSPGYNLVGAFVGSEGMLGVATKITVRLTRQAQTVRTMLADFVTVEAASRAVSDIIAAGIIPAALEMMDQGTIIAVERSVFASGLPQDAAAVLIIELDGLSARVEQDVESVTGICHRNGARQMTTARTDAERALLWAGRKGAFGAMARMAPDLLLQDVVIARSKLPQVLPKIYEIAGRHRLNLACVFHAGDGNLHPILFFDGRDPRQVTAVHEACDEFLHLCVDAGGTLTGEHGVGIDKMRHMHLVFTEDDLKAMSGVRCVFDPQRLANPGKVLPMHECRGY